ncbi:heterokaryon incompatibility protein-domain-containing protein [Halenospora varia]|nr:heterokaryon incompatibility protein-domain-containing protein [Halenospora varia]
MSHESSKGSDNQTQISFPVLPAAKSPLRFALLREWLQWCDKSHRCNQHDDDKDVNIPKKTLPTRLLYVGNPDDPDYDQDILKLVLGQQIGARKYIALSHCWGKLTTDQKNNFWTTKGNVDDRGREFSIAKLPRTFQDAIKVARELRILYLWIDSLCILQDDKEDWRFESARMEDVFTSAYCTVAATSAVDTNAGFLEQNISSENVYVQDNSSRRAYVCTDMADFDNKVEKAQLNTQAWVMQERLLSCQTIHFGANQTSRLI